MKNKTFSDDNTKTNIDFQTKNNKDVKKRAF